MMEAEKAWSKATQQALQVNLQALMAHQQAADKRFDEFLMRSAAY